MQENNPNNQQTEELTPQQYLNKLKKDFKPSTVDRDVQLQYIQNEDGVEMELTRENTHKKPVLHFKNCNNGTYTINKRVSAVKVLIESCNDCVFTINCELKTAVVEVWSCKNVEVHMYSQVGTAQIDLSENVLLSYEHKKWLGSVVQAGVEDMKIEFKDAEDFNQVTGLTPLGEIYDDIDPRIDQFITRWIKKELLTERIIRVENGYPTTERELQEQEEMGSVERTEEQLRNFMESAGSAMGMSEDELIKKSKEGSAMFQQKAKIDAEANLIKMKGNRAFVNGDFDKAIEFYTNAIEISPDNHVYYSNRAQCYIELEQYDLGEADARKSTELDDEFAKGFYRLAVCLKKLGRDEEALQAARDAYDLEPKNDDIACLYKDWKGL